MKKKKLYFRSIDDTFCETLEDIISDAAIEGLTTVKVVEATPDDGTEDMVWCLHSGCCVERNECSKKVCSDYSSKSGRGKCNNKGKLYLYGTEFEFDVSTGICLNPENSTEND